MKERKDHGCHANYDVKGYVSIDVAAKILGISQDKARDILKRKDVRRMDVCVNERGRPLAVYNKEEVIKLNIKRNTDAVDEILKGAKRIKESVPTVGDILREEKPKGDKKVYQPTYEDFFEWCGRTGDYPKKVFDDYVKTSNLGTASQSLIAGRALHDTLRQIRAEYFDMVKDFLLAAVGSEKPSRADLYRERAFRMGFNAMLDPEKGGAK